VIVDTGVLYALYDRRDAAHAKAAECIRHAQLDRRHFSIIRPRHIEAFNLVP